MGSLGSPEPGATPALDSSEGPSWEGAGCESQASSPAPGSQPPLAPFHLDPGARMKGLSWENGFEKLEAETNVDTGCTVVSSGPTPSFLSRFPRGLQTSQPPSGWPASAREAAASRNNRILKERVLPLSLAGQRDLSARKVLPKCPLHLPDQSEEKEEFFI